MTNIITQTRIDLADELISDGINAEYYIPPRITPPLVVVSPSNRYIAQGDTFATFEIGIVLTLIAQTASNAKATEDLDDLIVNTIGAIPAMWRIDSVDQPFSLNVNNAEFLSTRMALTTQITI